MFEDDFFSKYSSTTIFRKFSMSSFVIGRDILMQIDPNVEDVNAELYDRVKDRMKPSSYTKMMKKVYSDEVVKMKIRNILRSLKKLDNHTASEIDKKFPMNPKTDELFEKSYEKYLGENNLQENETTGYVIRKSTNPAVRFARIIVPITACIGIFAVSGKIASVFSNVEKNNKFYGKIKIIT